MDNIETDQQRFFNNNAGLNKPNLVNKFFLDYANKEQRDGFRWLRDKEVILDYGCGTGTSIDEFFRVNGDVNTFFFGVDIADQAIQSIKTSYPNFSFFTIKDNLIPQIQNKVVNGCYLLHVLHHSHDHEAIFQEVFSALSPNGKFFISDLSSNNPFIKVFRSLYIKCPMYIKNKFSEDLVVDGAIPEKYKVDPAQVIKQLKSVGFTIESVTYGHLFFFLFSWIDRFIPLSRYKIIRFFYAKLWYLETWFEKFNFCRKWSEVFSIKCIKLGKSLNSTEISSIKNDSQF